MSFRDIKDKARRSLHDIMQIPANFYSDGNPATTPVLCTIRVHTNVNRNQEVLAGTLLATPVDIEPKIIYLNEEVDPVRFSVFSVGAMEAYRVDHVEVEDGITQTAVVERLSESLAATFTPPDA